jgi:hypothetical protein
MTLRLCKFVALREGRVRRGTGADRPVERPLCMAIDPPHLPHPVAPEHADGLADAPARSADASTDGLRMLAGVAGFARL